MSNLSLRNVPVPDSVIAAIRHNCDLSDARDHGIYSMCTMILRLRNLYKWEQGLQPWQEPEPSTLLDWIEAKENFWAEHNDDSFQPLELNGGALDPFATREINLQLGNHNGKRLYYGAGYGRSLKAVFFLGSVREELQVGGVPLLVIGREHIREMAGALAFVQDGAIVVRRDLLRFFFWDQIQEMRGSCRSPFLYALQQYGLREDDSSRNRSGLLQDRLREELDTIVDTELDILVYHEMGELLESSLRPGSARALIGGFPGSVIEFVVRAIKDLLADTHPGGLLSHLIAEQKHSSLGFYLAFLDGLREKLFPEIAVAWRQFMQDGNWQHIEAARRKNREKCLRLTATINALASQLEESHSAESAHEEIQQIFAREILTPLGLALPEGAT